MLKVKIKHLAVESKIIKSEELKAVTLEEKSQLEYHRKFPLREEARHAQLAYAFIRGMPYRVVEPDAKRPPYKKRVRQLVLKFSKLCEYSYVTSKVSDKLCKELEEWWLAHPTDNVIGIKVE